ncbi:MAG: agmatinase [Anaerovoracaceae bacterium]|jgi:agmatinase
MMNKHTQTFLGCNADYQKGDVVIFGVPFDGTVSFRPGARFGPSFIRNESFGLETFSPYSNRDLSDYKIFDGGDLELPFGNAKRVLDMVEEYTEKVLNDGKKFLMMGGEHLITLGAVKAVLKHYPQVHIIQFDAHADLRTEYLGEELSHSTVMRRIWDLVGDGRIHQFGIRSGERQEFEFAKKHTDLHKFDLEDFADTVNQLKGRPVYFTLDLDVLDSSVFCGTGTPEAGGLTFKELLDGVLQLNRLKIIGCDINELAPHYDQSGSSTAAACKIIREILLQISGKGGY